MTKIGLKLWNTNIDSYYAHALQLYEKQCFDYIELYIVPGHIDKIEQWHETKIPFIVHAPHSANKMNLSRKSSAGHNRELYLEAKEYADKLRAKYIIFHGGVDGCCDETAQQIMGFNEPRAVIENKPCLTLPEVGGKQYVGYDVSSIRHIMEKAKCHFCLDIGHAIAAANALNIEPYSFVGEFCRLNPAMVHLSDISISTTMDAHLNFGFGGLDFKRIFKLLGAIPYLTIETNKKSSIDLADFLKDVIFLREYLI